MFVPQNQLGFAMDSVYIRDMQNLVAKVYPYLQRAFDALPGYTALPTTTKAKIDQILKDAFVGIDTSTDYARSMYFYSLADQLLTIAPSSVVTAVQQVSQQQGWGWASGGGNPGTGLTIDAVNKECAEEIEGFCWWHHFIIALAEKQRSFIPLSSEPTATNPVITGGQTVQIVGATSSESQTIAQPYGAGQQTAQVVTMPIYIASAPAPDTGLLPTSYTPAPIFDASKPPAGPIYDMPILQGTGAAQPTTAPASQGNSTLFLLAAILGFVVLTKRKG